MPPPRWLESRPQHIKLMFEVIRPRAIPLQMQSAYDRTENGCETASKEPETKRS